MTAIVVTAVFWAFSAWADKSAKDEGIEGSAPVTVEALEMPYHYIKIGWLEWAAAHFEAVAADMPDLGEAHVMTGLVLEALGDIDAAQEAYDRFLHVEDADVEAKNAVKVLLGMSLLKNSELAGAKTYLQDVLDEDYNAATAHYGLGVAYVHEGDLALATDHFTAAVEQAIDWLEPVIWLTSVYHGQQQYVEAYTLLRPREGLGFHDPEFQYYMARTADELLRLYDSGSLTEEHFESLDDVGIAADRLRFILTDQKRRAIERGLVLDPSHDGLRRLETVSK